MKLRWLKRLFRLTLLIALLGAVLFSGYHVQSLARPTILHQVAVEALAACRDPGTQWMVAVCLGVYFVAFLALEQRINPDPRGWHSGNVNLWLGGLALLALGHYALAYEAASSSTQLLVLLAGITLCKGAHVWVRWPGGEQAPAVRTALVLAILALLLSGSAFWQAETQVFQYHGQTRWSGPWENPNIYGVLMGLGLVLALGQLVSSLKFPAFAILRPGEQVSSPPSNAEWRTRKGLVGEWLKAALFLTATGVMGIGLVKSYSRGAWLGAALGLGYLAWSWWRSSDRSLSADRTQTGDSPPLSPGATSSVTQSADHRYSGAGKLVHSKARRMLLPVGVVIISLVILAIWNLRDTEIASVRRGLSIGNVNDFSWRNRVAAYEGALQVMADKPWFGHGWNQPEPIYTSLYKSPKVNEGMAIQMNDYFILGMTMGLPALACFILYSMLTFVSSPWSVVRSSSQTTAGSEQLTTDCWLKATCRAGATVLLVGFWFDGGLFKLSTGATFWILLELGREKRFENGHPA